MIHWKFNRDHDRHCRGGKVTVTAHRDSTAL
jgi:hypothetical protein